MKASRLFNVFLVSFVLGWMPYSVLSAVERSFSEPNAEAKAFKLPKISQARERLAKQFSGRGLAQKQVVVIETTTSVAQTDPEFLSLTIDAGDISRDWRGINFTASRIQNMAVALGPAMLRVGGTSADYLIFNVTQSSYAEHSNFSMSPAEWDDVNVFVEKVGWEFVFGLNALLRFPYPTGWDANNAELLMEYSNSKNYTVQWELGNEPDLWPVPITPDEHAKDFIELKELISQRKPPGKDIIGPDVAGDLLYFAQFIEQVPSGLLRAATYHHYYGNGETATIQDFYSISKLDSFLSTAASFQRTTEVLRPDMDVWLGETSSMYGGGAPNISDTYVAGFMWLDKLGIAAVLGHKRVFRQDFVGGTYGLLDSNQNPLPDYWLSVLYKRLVGTTVLYVMDSLLPGQYLRVYAHCAKPPYSEGSVVLLMLNLNFTTVTANLQNGQLASSRRDMYWLTPPSGNLNSTSVQLNGVTLKLVENTVLPDLKPMEQQANSTLTLPPISFGFVVFKDAIADACV